jgi:hypothetical protein
MGYTLLFDHNYNFNLSIQLIYSFSNLLIYEPNINLYQSKDENKQNVVKSIFPSFTDLNPLMPRESTTNLSQILMEELIPL